MKKHLIIAAFVSLGFGTNAVAAGIAKQVFSPAVIDSSKVYDLDEVVVVSSTKEFVPLRQQPLSSTSFTGNTMRMLALDDLRELSAYVPSFTMPNYGARLTSSMYIRGIGSRVNNPAVGVYLDDMPIRSKAAFNMYTYDIDHIDVLRGPQGTLYGQNTEGGLIRIYTKNPMDYQGTDLKLGIGTDFYRKSEISTYDKISDIFAFSLSAFYNGGNGFLTNTTTGDKADVYNEEGARMRWMVKPIQRLLLDIVADYQQVKQNGFPYGLLNTTNGTLADPSTTFNSSYERKMVNTGLNLKFHGNYFDLTATTSYQYLIDEMLMDQDYLPEDFLRLSQKQLQNTFTQEITLKGNRMKRWHWMLGAFMSNEWLKTNAPVSFGNAMTGMISGHIQGAMYNAMVDAFAKGLIAQGIPEDVARQQAIARIEAGGGVKLNLGMGAPGIYRTPQFNLGFYHQSDIDITDHLTATLGLRYDYNHVKIAYESSAYMDLYANVMGREATNRLLSQVKGKAKNDFNQLLPKFALTYKFDKQGLNSVYATVSKGYRAGGYNIQMFSDILQAELMSNYQKAQRGDFEVTYSEEDYQRINQTISYKPEVSWNYELGTHLSLLDNTLFVDLAGYYMEVKNQQLSVMAGEFGFGRMMVNAGKSHSCGVEASLAGSLFNRHFNWRATYGYTRSIFDEYTDNLRVGGQMQEISYKGNYVPYIPMHTFSAKADYRFDLGLNWLKNIVLGADVTGQGRTYWDEANTVSQNLYALLGAHLSADMGWLKVNFWARNLLNNEYQVFAVNSAASGRPNVFAQKGYHRQIGVDLNLHF